MTEKTRSFASSDLRCHSLSLTLVVASVVLFWGPLRELAALALANDPYSYILLIPAISAFVLYMERRNACAGVGANHGSIRAAAGPTIALVVSGVLAELLATRAVKLPEEYDLSIRVLTVVLTWAAIFAVCYGAQILKAASFPFLLLLLVVPIPSRLMDKIVTSLQWGAADATYALFHLAGVPVFRTGVNFELPVIGIEVAKECSSIHSACALFITSLLVGHLFLRSLRAKVCLALLAIPIAMFTNAVRIVTLWFLATKVDMGFLYGNLHHNGGILFSLVSLSILIGCLYLLRTLERAGRRVAGCEAVI